MKQLPSAYENPVQNNTALPGFFVVGWCMFVSSYLEIQITSQIYRIGGTPYVDAATLNCPRPIQILTYVASVSHPHNLFFFD
jgi:hypothetical protein